MNHPQPILVSVADLLPNPFRNLKEIPIDEARIKELQPKLESSGFWNCMYGRKFGKKIQIAFGHHRVEIAKRLKTKRIYMTVMPLSDGEMLRYMSDENTGNNVDAALINNDVRKAKEYWDDKIAKFPMYKDFCLQDALGAELFENTKAYAAAKKGIGEDKLSIALNLSPNRVRAALAVTKAIAEKVVSEKAVNILPSQEAQKVFTTAVKQGKPISPSLQKGIAKTIVKEKVGVRDIPARVAELRPDKPRAKDKALEKPILDDYVKTTSGMIAEVSKRIRRIKGNEDSIQSKIVYDNYILSAESLHDVLLDILPESE